MKTGSKHLTATIAKMRAARIGKAPWNKGKITPTETRLKIGASNKGKNLGRKKPQRSEEHRRRLSESLTGRIPSKKWREMHSRQVGQNAPNWRGGITTYERKKWFNNRRRVLRIGAGGSHTEKEWEELKNKYNATCPSCGLEEPDIILTRDHVVPLILGGRDDIQNIQPLCRSCNSRKHKKIIRFNYEPKN